MAGTLAEAMSDVRRPARPRWFRVVFVCAATAIAIFACVITAWRAVPEFVISRALRYETYRDDRGIALGLQDLERRHEKKPGSGGGSMSPIEVDFDRRYYVIALPWLKDEGNPDARFMCWAVLDTRQGGIVGSLRLPSAASMMWGMPCTTQGNHSAPIITSSHSIVWAITASATLPKWWPGRNRWGSDGRITRTEYVSFEPASGAWKSVALDKDEEKLLRQERWLSRVNHALPIPDSLDELVAEHDFTNEEYPKPSFRRLIRRSRTDGQVRWEIRRDQFPSPGLRKGITQLMIPQCRLDSSVEWCLVLEHTTQSRMFLETKLWRLNVSDGGLQQIEASGNSTHNSGQVASDGQTLVFLDDVSVHQRVAGGGGSAIPAELVAWHPDHGIRDLVQYEPGSDAEYHCVLPGGRILLVDSRGLMKLRIRIVSLDGMSPRVIGDYQP
jgi:hypothetical protein